MHTNKIFEGGNGDEEDFSETAQKHLDFVSFLKNYLCQTYGTTRQLTATTITKSTAEVFTALQELFPSAAYTIEDIAIWLHDGGYAFTDMGDMKFEWMLTKI